MYLPYFKIEILVSPQLTTPLSFEQQGPCILHSFSEENKCTEYSMKRSHKLLQ